MTNPSDRPPGRFLRRVSPETPDGGSAAGPSTPIRVAMPVSVGELIDRLTQLQVRQHMLQDERRLAEIRHAREVLERILLGAVPAGPELDQLRLRMGRINHDLFHIRGEMRDLERDRNMGERFAFLARQLFQLEDQRGAVRAAIDERFPSGVFDAEARC